MNITICIATFRRPERLAALLDDLVRQNQVPASVVVVDNDAAGSALAAVERRRRDGAPFPILYEVQPVKNISLTRNRTVQLAQGDWLAFIDDDERAPPEWIGNLARAGARFGADGVLGPVVPVLPDNAPAWIRAGRFYDWVRMDSGSVVPLNRLRFGNVLLHSELLRLFPVPFDPDYGLTGGEDGDLLARLVQRGARIVWCDEAVVHEPVEGARLSLRWLLLRSLRGGQDFARHKLAGRYGAGHALSSALLLSRGILQAIAAAAMALVSWPFGRHFSAFWLLKAAANFGKVSIFVGSHYREYGPQTGPSSA
jgi:succinoglycan biosynthesis protein ExoM